MLYQAVVDTCCTLKLGEFLHMYLCISPVVAKSFICPILHISAAHLFTVPLPRHPRLYFQSGTKNLHHHMIWTEQPRAPGLVRGIKDTFKLKTKPPHYGWSTDK